MKLRKTVEKFYGVIFHPCSSLCGSQQTLDHAGDQCVQCFIDGILYLALLNGIRNVNFWKSCFPSHLYVSYTMTSSESQPSHRGLSWAQRYSEALDFL